MTPEEQIAEIQRLVAHINGEQVFSDPTPPAIPPPTTGTWYPPFGSPSASSLGPTKKGPSLNPFYDPPAPPPSAPKTNKLKVNCWICQKDAVTSQYWDFSNAKNTIRITCCNREQTIQLTDEQIEKSNEQGTFWAFMI